MAKVDVLVPCYNYARYLTDCVRSVLDQSIKDVRVLVIDDASSDETLQVANGLSAADKRVHVIGHAHNRGHIATFNEGIEWADSDYFLLLSADDLLLPGALERAVDVMENNPDVVMTYGQCLSWHDENPMPRMIPGHEYTWSRHDLLKEICTTATNVVPTPTAIVRTRTQKEIGGYRPSLPHAGDMEMWLRFAAHGAVARIDAMQAIYRKHPAAMSNAYFAEMLSDYRQCQLTFDSFWELYGNRAGVSLGLQAVARRALAERVFNHGILLLRRGRLKDGVQLIREAFSMEPQLSRRPPLWRLFKVPGPEGRQRAFSAIRRSAARALGLHLKQEGASQRQGM